MAFNGTENFEKQEMVDFLEGIGMRFGPDLNAYTSFGETVYMLQVPLDDPEIVDKAFVILNDWASGIVFDPEEIDKERGVVLEEWRLGRGAQQRILDKEIPVLFHQSRYAERLPIGKTNIVATAKQEAFTRYYQNWYRPDLMAVIAVGDFESEVMEDLIRKHFSGLVNPPNAPEREEFPVPDHEETLFSIQTDPELPYALIQIVYKHPPAQGATRGDYRRSLVESLYTAMMNARLSERLQSANPPYLAATVGKLQLARSKDLFLQGAAVKEGAYEEGLTALLLEAERVKRDGFTATELARTKTATLRSYERAYNERDKSQSAGYAAELIRHFLVDEPIPGIEVELELVREFLEGVTLDEVNVAAKNWITDANRVILYSAPEKEGVPVPSKGDILSILTSASGEEFEAYDDGSTEAPLVGARPRAGKVVRERRFPESGVLEWTLSNDVVVWLKPTDFKNDQILMRAFSPGGHSLVDDARFVPAATAATVVGQGGLGEFDLVQLNKKLAGKIASVGASIGGLFEEASGSASPDDIETFFELIHLRFTAPRKDPEVFAGLVARNRDFVRNREKNPAVVFFRRD